MRFTLPQFIEQETKIIGPLTFRQFVFVALAIATLFVFYLLMPFAVFVVILVLLGGGGALLSFLKIDGIPLYSILLGFIRFGTISKIYVWRSKERGKIDFYKEEMKKKNSNGKQEAPLKIAARSQLKKLQAKVETLSD